MQPQAQDTWSPRSWKRREGCPRSRPPPQPLEGAQPCHTLISDVWPPEPGEDNLCGLSQVCGQLLWPPRTLGQDGEASFSRFIQQSQGATLTLGSNSCHPGLGAPLTRARLAPSVRPRTSTGSQEACERSSPGMLELGRARPLSTCPGGTGSPIVWDKEDEVGPRRRPGVQLPVLLSVGGGSAGPPAPTLHCQRVAEVTSSLLQNLLAYWDTDHPPPAPTPIMGLQHQSLGPGPVPSTPGRTERPWGEGDHNRARPHGRRPRGTRTVTPDANPGTVPLPQEPPRGQAHA